MRRVVKRSAVASIGGSAEGADCGRRRSGGREKREGGIIVVE